MKKVRYQVAMSFGPAVYRDGYLFDLTASSGETVLLVVSKSKGIWLADHFQTGYGLSCRWDTTRKALVDQIKREGVALADRIIKGSNGRPILNEVEPQ